MVTIKKILKMSQDNIYILRDESDPFSRNLAHEIYEKYRNTNKKVEFIPLDNVNNNYI